MHLALIIDDYLPHSTKVAAKMFHELALELQARGNKVIVITPAPALNSNFEERIIDGITVWQFKSGEVKCSNKVKRAINESLLPLRAWLSTKNALKDKKIDGVVFYSPSIFFGLYVKYIKRLFSCPSYLVLRDFFPQWAIDMNLIKEGSLIEKYFRFFELQSYRYADSIGVMSDKNLHEFIHQQREFAPKVEVLRNWASLSPSQEKYGIRQKLGIEDKVIFFYGGNIGHAQDMQNLATLARNMLAYKNAHFLFVGSGDEVDLLCSLKEKWDLTNMTYIPPVSQGEFKRILKEVDIGLFSLSKLHSAHNFPGKLLGYMVESLPILGSVNYKNDLIQVVNQAEAGLVTVNGDDELFLENAKRLLLNEDLRLNLGGNAHKLLKDEFSVSTAAESILQGLHKVDCL